MTRSVLFSLLLLARLLASAAQQTPYCQVSQNRPEDGLATTRQGAAALGAAASVIVALGLLHGSASSLHAPRARCGKPPPPSDTCLPHADTCLPRVLHCSA